MAHVVTVSERKFVDALIKALGGDPSRNYLEAVFLAWLYQESGSLKKAVGFNPFNIRDSKFAYAYRQMKGNGHFALFKNETIGGQATAWLLLHNSWAGYDLIVAAVRRGLNPDPKVHDDQRQALDVMSAIAMSKWDSAHYGDPTGQNITKNHIYKVWLTITNLPAIPPDVTKPPPSVPRPALPEDHNVYRPHDKAYIDPYRAKGFYMAKHGALPPLTGGLL